MKVNILGTDYEIIVKKYDEDKEFERRSIDGYCDFFAKQIVICDMRTYKGWELESEASAKTEQKKTLRHEIVHAFLYESGLAYSSNDCEYAWAMNEEMVDWFALQGEKLYKAWQEANALA